MQVEDELLDINGVCRFWGGAETPVHYSTIYRAITVGAHPSPIHPAPNLSRWLRSELQSALAWRVALRDGRSRAASWAQWTAELAEQRSEEAAA
jgi:predicted DNA-binding transcriptional regulator AlpA